MNELERESEIPSVKGVHRGLTTPLTIKTSEKATNPNLKYRERKRLRSGNLVHRGSSPSLLVGSRLRTALRKYHYKKSRLQNKSSSSWNAQPGTSSNLIISFSDGEDDDSELEDANLQIMAAAKSKKGMIDKSRQPINAGNLQSKSMQHDTNALKKTAVDHPSVSLRTIHDKAEPVTDANVSKDNLRSLREQIAKRESVIVQGKSVNSKKDYLSLRRDSFVSGHRQLEKMQTNQPLSSKSKSKERQCLQFNFNPSESSHLGTENMVAPHSSERPASERSNLVSQQFAGAIRQSQAKDKEHPVIFFEDPNQPEPQQHSALDRDDVLRLEEVYDYELEEAQEYRRKCELQEMQALKAYRKAREELIAANNKCFDLYRQREVLSLMATKWPNSAENLLNSSNGLITEVDRMGIPERHNYTEGSHELCTDMETAVESEPPQKYSIERAHDFELEASLRTKLVAKMGTRSSLKHPSKRYEGDKMTRNETELAGGGNTLNSLTTGEKSPIPSLELREYQSIDEGSEISGRNHIQVGEEAVQACAADICLDCTSSSIQPEAGVPGQPTSVHSCSWIVGSHIKLFPSMLKISRKSPQELRSERSMLINHIAAVGSDTVEISIDPFWPLCMFELRGKCNDDECQWQHFKSRKKQKTKPAASIALSPETLVDHGFLHQLPHYSILMPVYNIGSYIMEADQVLDQSVLACCAQQYWDVSFCASHVIPLCIQRAVPSYDIDVWNRPSLYFSCEAERTKNFKEGLNDPERTLEIAIDLLNGKMNNKALKREVLPLLSRALETNPHSVLLWFVYLHIYYRGEKSIGNDDMFSFAVKFNQDSYELWHLYICSRLTFDDRIAAYGKALSAFYRKAQSLTGSEEKHTSSCILDLSLQMIHCLCMHGNANVAISQVSELIHPITDKKDSDCPQFTDILSCLENTDKCILWMSCLHLVIYRRLPEAIVGRFELPKDLAFVIEWPASTLLSPEHRFLAFKFMDNIVEIIKALENSPALEENLIQFLAVNHVKCLTALCGSLDDYSDILASFLQRHPTCIDLHLIHLRPRTAISAIDIRMAFREAIAKWPKDIPGCQCLWNQLVEFCLSHRLLEAAEKLMEDWFQENRGVDYLALTLPSQFSSNQDAVYGLLNLGLYNLIHRDVDGSRAAVNRALALATGDEYVACVREHAALIAGCLNQPRGDAVLSLLSGYLSDARASPKLEPLTLKVFSGLRSSRLRQTVSCFLGRVVADPSLLNSALEALFGLHLLPEAFDEAKDLVDFVEGLMEIAPSNHRLAVEVCDSLSRVGCSSSFGSHGLRFWAGTLLVNAVFQCCPVAPESVWLSSVDVLCQLQNQPLLDAFHKRAVAVHPFSLKLWQSYYRLSEPRGNGAAVAESARKRGVFQDLKS